MSKNDAIWSFNLSADLNNDLDFLEEQLAKQEKEKKKNQNNYKEFCGWYHHLFSALWVSELSHGFAQKYQSKSHFKPTPLPNIYPHSSIATNWVNVCLSEIKARKRSEPQQQLTTLKQRLVLWNFQAKLRKDMHSTNDIGEINKQSLYNVCRDQGRLCFWQNWKKKKRFLKRHR